MSEDRKGFLGGSDAPAILGVDPYSGPHDVFMEKTGMVPDQPDNPYMKWGRKLEDLIAEEWTERTGFLAERGTRTTHPKLAFLRGTPDRLVQGQSKLLEIKTTNARQSFRWGEPGTDQIPEEYLVQALTYLAITDRESADVPVLIGGSDFRIYTVIRNLELEGIILDRLAKFWHDHILTGLPPPIDGSASARKYLSVAYPREDSPVLLNATPEDMPAINKLQAARTAFKTAEDFKREAENELKARLGDAAGIEGASFRITWKRTKDGAKTDWEAVARSLGNFNKPAFDTAVSGYTMPHPGHRRLLAKFQGEDNE